MYLREARNAVEHGLAPFAAFSKAYVSIADNVVKVENGKVSIGNLVVNGQQLGHVNVNVNLGKVVSLAGNERIIAEVPFGITLTNLATPDKRIKIVRPPQTVFGHKVLMQNPSDLVEKATQGLNIKYADLVALQLGKGN